MTAVTALTAMIALTAVTAWRHNNSSGKYWQWRQCQILTATADRYWQRQPTDIDNDSRQILTVPGIDGGGTLDRASACPATHIHSYAKTFSKFAAIYNHLSHFHKPALTCDRYHTYISYLLLQNILLVQALVMYYDFKWLLSHLYTGGGGSIRHATISFTFCTCIKIFSQVL